jgi:hypothetical protein
MHRLPRLIAAFALGAAAALPARAGVIFTPHLSEYARLAPGPYDEGALTLTRIDEVYDRNGDTVPLGAPFVPRGEHIDAGLLTYKTLWVGQPLRGFDLPPALRDREFFCRAILTLGWQQASAGVAERSRAFGQVSGASGPGDVFGLCGVYGSEHRIGPVKFNGLFGTTVKFPVGRYERDALVNVGTNYWSTIPQLALHAQAGGRVFLDATLAWQFNGRNDAPAYGGLSPSDPADVANGEFNLAWKFSERWFADAGVSHRRTQGGNRYDAVDVRNVEPLEAGSACAVLALDAERCAATRSFFLQSRPGRYRDQGVRATLLTLGLSYVYRSSSVLSLRLLQPVDGRGGQIDVPFDLYLAVPDAQNPGSFTRAPGPPLLQTTSTLSGVQEAAAVSASPALELRFVHLFWAP